MYKKYIVLDSENWIVNILSNAYSNDLEGHVFLEENESPLPSMCNNSVYLDNIRTSEGQLKYRFENGQVVEKLKPFTKSELIKLHSLRIDDITRSLFDSGFEFDSKVFSLSIEAQSNWNTLSLLFMKGFFPQEGLIIATRDSSPYLLTYEKADSFFTACFYFGREYYGSGLNEKAKLYNMNLQELLNYKDPR